MVPQRLTMLKTCQTMEVFRLDIEFKNWLRPSMFLFEDGRGSGWERVIFLKSLIIKLIIDNVQKV